MNAIRTDSSMRLLRDALGFVALAATLALAWPGVQIARAAEQAADELAGMSVDPALVRAQNLRVQTAETGPRLPVAPAAAGPSCSNPGVPSPLTDAMVEHQSRRMLRELVKRAAAQPQPGTQSSEHGIVLNSRGYNYRPTPIR